MIQRTSLVEELGSVKIPYYRRIINFGFSTYERIAQGIDSFLPEDREWNKVYLLANELNYLEFLCELTGKSKGVVVKYLNEFFEDEKFKDTWFSTLKEFQDNYSDVAGDVRFNSLSLYVIVRALRPSIVIETGVAAGKSSTLILLAMEHNQKGRLFSFDLPNFESKRLEDGARTTTRDKDVGWLVPDYLRERWELSLGDSLKEMPKAYEKLSSGVDIFFHDSLHTYEHTKKELKLVYEMLNDKSLVLVDDIDLDCGNAFHDFLENKNLVGVAYRELGGVQINKVVAC